MVRKFFLIESSHKALLGFPVVGLQDKNFFAYSLDLLKMKDREGTFRYKCCTDGCSCQEFDTNNDGQIVCRCSHHAADHDTVQGKFVYVYKI